MAKGEREGNPMTTLRQRCEKETVTATLPQRCEKATRRGRGSYGDAVGSEREWAVTETKRGGYYENSNITKKDVKGNHIPATLTQGRRKNVAVTLRSATCNKTLQE
jgi:hypothetical protein